MQGTQSIVFVARIVTILLACALAVPTPFTIVYGVLLGNVLVITDKRRYLQKPALNQIPGVFVIITRFLQAFFLLDGMIPFTQLFAVTKIRFSAAIVSLMQPTILFMPRWLIRVRAKKNKT